MNAITWQEFVDFMEAMLSDLNSFSIADAVQKGLPVSTTMKMRRIETPEDIIELRSKTIFQTAKVVDRLNLENHGKKTYYQYEFRKLMRGIITDYLGKKTFSELRDEAVVPTPMVSKLRKEKADGNYHIGTIAKIIEFLNKKNN